MADGHGAVSDSTAHTAGMLPWSNRPLNEVMNRTMPGCGPDDEASRPESLRSLTIGLIDCCLFSQECLTRACAERHPDLRILPFTAASDCIAEARSDLDILLYHSHGDASETAVAQIVAALCQACPSVPVIVLSDTEPANQSRTMRAVLKSGARGFIPTRTAGLSITFAAIRFVRAGGTFAPVDLLLSHQTERAPTRPNRLTSRQMTVLAHLRQGKANKIIAHELGMSESTVKIHVRNIMRKMDATNRTQVAYKAQKLLSGEELAK